MNTMKALRFEKYGPPSVLSVQELRVPEPKPGQALVELHASAINPSDVKNVAGVFKASLPRVPGRDYAGVVTAGDGWKGKEVWGSGPGFGVTRDGTDAQYLVVELDSLSEKPAKLSMAEASAVGVPYLAAWSALVDAAEIQPGETVLITGALGGVGQAATQVAHWKKARVIGADRHDGASDADAFVNMATKDLPVEVKALTEGEGGGSRARCRGWSRVRAVPAIAAPGRPSGDHHEYRRRTRRVQSRGILSQPSAPDRRRYRKTLRSCDCEDHGSSASGLRGWPSTSIARADVAAGTGCSTRTRRSRRERRRASRSFYPGTPEVYAGVERSLRPVVGPVTIGVPFASLGGWSARERRVLAGSPGDALATGERTP